MKPRVLLFSGEDYLHALISVILQEHGYEFFEFSKIGSCPLSAEDECSCPRDSVCSDIIITDISLRPATALEHLDNQLKNGCAVRFCGALSPDWPAQFLRYARDLGCMTFQKPIAARMFDAWLDSCVDGMDPDRRLWDWSGGDKKAEIKK